MQLNYTLERKKGHKNYMYDGSLSRNPIQENKSPLDWEWGNYMYI